MRKDNINGKRVVIYDSITNIPIKNYQGYNSNLVLDMGIGSSSEDIKRHYLEIYDLIARDKKEHALQAVTNYFQTLNFIQQHHSPKHESFKNLVHLIDGKEPNEDTLNDLKPTIGYIQKTVDWFKKKAKTRLTLSSKSRKAKAT